MIRFGGKLWRLRQSLRYVRKWIRTPAAQRVPAPRLLGMWQCGLHGHQFGDNATFVISPYRFQFCERCGEEIAWRTDWLALAPTPEEQRWELEHDLFDQDGEP